MCYIYILECSDKHCTLVGLIILKKNETHSKGKGAKYTRARLPVKLVYFEKYNDKISAQKREYEIKQMSRKEKLKLINDIS